MGDGFDDLRGYLELLEAQGQLLRVKAALSPVHEIPAALRYLDRRVDQAVYFENVTGYRCPVVGNLFGSRERVALALGTTADPSQEYVRRLDNPIAPVMVSSGPVKEVVSDRVDLLRDIPVLTHHEKDNGPYLTCAVSVARDPETGQRSTGLHRIQVKGRNRIGISLNNPPIAAFFRKAEDMGRPLEIAIVSGLDPLTFLAAVAWAPAGVDKLTLAGALRGRPVPMVSCESVDLEVPAQAEFVMEGRVLPHVREPEGPLGESSGYYCTFENPVCEIDMITRRQSPVYHGLMPFNRDNAVILSVLWEGDAIRSSQKHFPYTKRVRLTSSVPQHALVQIDKGDERQPREIIEHILNSSPYIKGVVVVDNDVDLDDPVDVEWAMATRFQPVSDLVVLPDVTGSRIDPSARAGRTSKWGLDATRPLDGGERYERVRVAPSVEARIRQLLSDAT